MDIKTDNQLTKKTLKKTPTNQRALYLIRTQEEKKKRRVFFISVLIDLRAGINALVNTNSLCNGA